MFEERINRLTKELEDKNIVEQFEIIEKEFGISAAFSTSFGEEDQVITHIIFQNNIPIRIFTLDTGRLFEETLKTMQRTIEKYNKKIEVYFPDYEDIEQLVSEKGPFSFYESVENRKECCHIRKVKPLNRALKGVKLWITGLRRQQSAARQNLQILEFDSTHNLIKFNPLYKWTLQEVKNFIKENLIPYNPLHDRGFVSIGCAPCTRAIKPGEDIRAGRWWWEDNTKKECGLHEKNNDTDKLPGIKNMEIS